MQVIEISAKEWFDRTNGNSYFSAQINIDGKFVTSLPFQYGYGDHYVDMACRRLQELGVVPNDDRTHLRYLAADLGAVLIYHKQEKCLKRDVVAFGARA